MAADLRLGIIIRANSGNLPATLDDTRNRLNGVRQSTGSVNREFAEMARQTFDVGGAFRAMAAGLSAIALFQGVRSLIDFADTMKLLDGRIQLATTSVQDYARANAALVEISMHTGTAFEANATLFSRINTSLRIMGGTTQTTLQFTELLAKGLRISGAAASEASSVIRQLAQAMASGVVRGDEFNSIMENGSRVAQALADGLHVDIGVLRKMAEAGELSAGKVANALLSQSAILDAEFKRMPLTVSAALENIKTAFGQYISVADQGSAATASLSGSLNSLAQNLPAVLDSVITLAKIAIGYFAATITGGIIHYGQSVLIARAHTQALAIEAQRAAAARLSEAQATATSTAASAAHAQTTLADLAATQANLETAMIRKAAQMAAAQASMAAARATIAATNATIQSTSILYINAQANAALTEAQTLRAAAIRRLDVLGRRQLTLEAELTVATVAHTNAQHAAAAASARLASLTTGAATSVGFLSRAVGFLGGPIGVITTLLGLGVTAWLLWGGAATDELSAVELKAKQAADAIEARHISLSDRIQGTWQAISQTAQESSGVTKDQWDMAMDAIGYASENLGQTIAKAMSWAWDIIKDRAAQAANRIMGIFAGVGAVIGEIFSTLASNVSTSLNNMSAGAKAMATDLSAAALLDFSFTESKSVVFKPLIEGSAAGLVETFNKAFNVDRMGKFNDKVNVTTTSINALRNATAETAKQTALLDSSRKDYSTAAATAKEEAAKLKTVEVVTEQHNLTLKKLNDDLVRHSKTALSEINKAESDAAKAMASGDKDKIKNATENLRLSKKIFEQYKNNTRQLIESENTDFAKFTESQNKAAKSAADKVAKEAERKAQAVAKGIADELASLSDQHDKLSLSERDYFKTTLAAKGMSAPIQEMALAIWDSNKALEAQKAANDKAQSAMESLIDQYNRLTLSAREYFAETLRRDGITPEKAAPILQQFDKVEVAKAQKNKIDETRKALESYNKTLDSAKTQMMDFGDVSSSVFDGALGGISTLAGAFGKVTDSIKENSAAMAELSAMQEANAAAIAKTAEEKQFQSDNAIKYAQRESELTAQKTQLEIDGARQIAGAAAKLFGEKTQAAKAFHTVETVLAVASMAMKAKEMAVSFAATTVKMAEGAATMFAESGWLGFAGVAAMVAVMAAMGYSASGGAGSSRPPEFATDTGTVLGDKAAQSQSVDKTYQLLKDIHAAEYRELRGINSGVAALSTGITNVITRLFQAGGLSDAKINTFSDKLTSIGSLIQDGSGIGRFDPIANFLLGGLFGKVKAEIVNAGILTNPTSIGSIVSGGDLIANQFSTIKTTTESWFSKSTHYTEQLDGLDSSVKDALTSVFASMGSSMLSMAKAFGGDLTAKIQDYIIPSLRIDLKGLNGEDAAKKLNAVISTQLDTMTNAIFGAVIGNYQQLGEGLFETATRLVTQAAIVKDALAQSGTAINGDAIAISDGLVQLAGGLKAFQSQFETYYDKFFTDAEKQARSQTTLADALKDVNLYLPITRQGYRDMMDALNLSNAADRERYALLLQLSGAADTYYKTLEEGQKSLIDAVKNAYDTAAGLIKNQIDTWRGFANSLTSFRDQLKGGPLSTVMPKEKYDASKAEFERLAKLAKTGTAEQKIDALGKLQGAAQSFLDNSKSFSPANYAKDYSSVLRILDSAIGTSTTKADVAQAQLDKLTDQVTALGVLNTSVMNVESAVKALTLAMTNLKTANEANATIAAQNANRAAFDTQEADRRATYETPITTKAQAYATIGANLQNAGSARGLTNTSKSDFSVSASFNARTGTNTSTYDGYTGGGNAGQVWATLTSDNGQFVRVRNLVAQVGRRVEDLVGGALPDISLRLGKTASSYNFGDKSGNYPGDNIDSLMKGFANDATDYLADKLGDKAWSEQIKAVNFSSLASGLSELSMLMAHLRTPFKEQVFNPANDYTKINGTHRGGLDRVPFDGYIAELHQDERVLTAPEAAAYHRQTIVNSNIDKSNKSMINSRPFTAWYQSTTSNVANNAADLSAYKTPLAHYAKGGIANEASIFGEAGPEAAVPLPDGKSIPVVLFDKTQGSRHTNSPPVHVNVKDTTDDDRRNTQAIVDTILLSIKANAAGQGELRRELRETKDKLDKLQRAMDKVKS